MILQQSRARAPKDKYFSFKTPSIIVRISNPKNKATEIRIIWSYMPEYLLTTLYEYFIELSLETLSTYKWAPGRHH